MTVRTIPVSPFDLVIFGGTGALARRKLLPTMYNRDRAGQLPAQARIIAAARHDHTNDSYRELAEAALRDFVPKGKLEASVQKRFLARLHFARVDVAAENGLANLATTLADNPRDVRAYYLAVAPDLFGQICTQLAAHGLVAAGNRVVVEKPFVRDRESATALTDEIAHVFCEDCIYRIDHYLG